MSSFVTSRNSVIFLFTSWLTAPYSASFVHYIRCTCPKPSTFPNYVFDLSRLPHILISNLVLQNELEKKKQSRGPTEVIERCINFRAMLLWKKVFVAWAQKRSNPTHHCDINFTFHIMFLSNVMAKLRVCILFSFIMTTLMLDDIHQRKSSLRPFDSKKKVWAPSPYVVSKGDNFPTKLIFCHINIPKH